MCADNLSRQSSNPISPSLSANSPRKLSRLCMLVRRRDALGPIRLHQPHTTTPRPTLTPTDPPETVTFCPFTTVTPTPPHRLSTSRRMLVGYGVVSSATSLPIQPPRVRNLQVRALRATPRGEESPQNGGWWDVAHLSEGGGGGLRRDATTKPGLLRGPGRDPTWLGWGRIWPDGGVGMSRSRLPSRLTG